MKILITGGAGFIGSHLTLALQKKYPDAEITVYDNLISGCWKNLVGFKGQIITNEKQLDCSDNFDFVFHLGSNTDTTNSNCKQHLENNVLELNEYLWRVQKGKIIYASSASVYGTGATKPSIETDDLKPANAYAFSKVQLENYMQKKYPKNSAGFRFFNVYGPNELHKGISTSMVTQILSKVKKGENVKLFPDGNQVRDFIYVKDVAELLIKASENFKPGIYNLGTGESRSFNEIFKIAKELYPEFNSEIQWINNPYKAFFQERTTADMSKTIETFNWSPSYRLEEGIEDYYKSL